MSVNLVIKPKGGEPVEKILRRFKRKLDKLEVLDIFKSKMFFVKPSVRKREERKAAKRKQYLSSLEEKRNY